MKNKLPTKWLENLAILDIAFQPIINIHTGKIYAVEALLRNHNNIGFKSIFHIFDAVYDEGILYAFDLALREKTIQKFTEINNYEDMKLFYNLDNRLFEMSDFETGNTEKILEKFNLKKDNICFEISERHEISRHCDISAVLSHYQQENFSIALDDFGTGHSGYKLLYNSAPDILKIDRFFLSNIEKIIKKKLIVRNIINLCIQLGIKVVAEGVETKEEYFICKELGCNLAQGYLVQRPTLNPIEIIQNYADIIELINSSKRDSANDSNIKKHLIKVAPINIRTKMDYVVEYFKKNKEISVVPIVDMDNEPIGIIEEQQIKDFLYSPYGISLIKNDTNSKSKLKNLIKPCSFTDVNSDIATIIELFSNNKEAIGTIVTKNSKYYGWLSARAIINIMNEENLLFAREQNPLTKLPGNTMIERYIEKISKSRNNFMLCYFDLDNFKAFNDVYGFRNGDRVILLFAEILKKHLAKEFFIAHIGGDDFFIAIEFKEEESKQFIEKILLIIKIFTEDVKSFYSLEDREKESIVSKDRDGNMKKFPLSTVSASAIFIEQKTSNRSSSDINNILSLQKKVAKNASNNISISTLL